MMFEWLKRKMHRNDDIDDIRSSVLGERFDEPALPKRERFDPDLRDPLEKVSDTRFDESFEEPPGFKTIDTRAPQRFDKNENYEIMDRLNLIESQIASIRSMTETINERLKNMESRLGPRRY